MLASRTRCRRSDDVLVTLCVLTLRLPLAFLTRKTICSEGNYTQSWKVTKKHEFTPIRA